MNATILGTRATLTRVERAAYSAALAELSGLRPHDDVAAWRRWLTAWSARNRKIRANGGHPQRTAGP